VKRLKGMDAMLLYNETPNVHMHTIKVGILDMSDAEEAFSFERFRGAAYPVMLGLPPLRYQLVDIPLKLHHPMWQENADIDLDYHLRQVRVPAPAGRRELERVIGDIASTPLDRSRPLWEMYVAEGLVGDRVAVIHKVHHTLADGVASANQMAKAISMLEQSEGVDPASVTVRTPRASELLRAAGRDHVKQIRRLPGLIRETAAGVSGVRRRGAERGKHPELARAFAPPPSFINHVIPNGRRRFATAPLALADVKETSKHLGVTLNDVILATAAGALRELLLRYDGHADVPLIAGMPACFDSSPDRLAGNAFGYMMPSVPTHIDDPLERVKLTSLATSIAKEDYQLLGPTTMTEWMAYLPTAIAPPVFRWQENRADSATVMNLTISNVPGPRILGHVGGATLSEIYSVGPLVAGSGMNITVWSYVDRLSISVIVDDLTLGDPHEATDAMVHAFTELRVAAGLSAELTSVAAALPLAGGH
jgi:diacylglycerol O-acyltransferase